jgi:hypothetical protein
MARPGQLASTIARLFGAPEPSVRQQARDLRDAGYLSKEKQGRGAGHMGARDAAHFLIAAASGSSVKGGIRAIKRQGQLVPKKGGKWRLGFMPLPELRGLPPQHRFVDALTALLKAGVSGTLEREIEDVQGTPLVEVTLAGPIPWASIEFSLFKSDEEEGQILVAEEAHRYDRNARAGTGHLAGLPMAAIEEAEPDLSYRYTFTQRTIIEIANLLRGTRER